MPWHNKKRGKWIGRVMINGERVQVGEYATKREATEAEIEYRKTRKLTREVMSITGVRDSWLRDGRRRWKASTAIEQERRTRDFEAQYGKRAAHEFSVPEAMEWAGKSGHTVEALRAMFSHGRRMGVVHANPFDRLSPPRTSSQIIEPGRGALTLDEVEQLAGIAERLDGVWHRSLVLFAAFTGLRIGEVLAVRYTDMGAGRLTISRAYNTTTNTYDTPKNGNTRVVVLPPQAFDAIQAMPRRAGLDEIFFAPQSGEPMTSRSYERYWKSVRDAFMLTLDESHWLVARDRKARARQEREGKRVTGKALVFHELRHTCATMLLEAGVSPEDVAIQLGHTDGGDLVRSTYGHMDRERQLDRVARAFGQLHVVGGGKATLRGVKGGRAS